MDGKRLVEVVFEGGEPPRPPLHVESDDKAFEASLSDALGAGVRIANWRGFFELGGPFRRLNGEPLGQWLDRVDADAYEWPDPAEAARLAVEGFLKRVEGLAKGKFLILKVLGPTETAEGFFAPPSGERGRALGQMYHRFGFGSFYALRRAEALKVYERIASVVLEVVKLGAELDQVDAVRIADDAASYAGPVYSRSFYEEAYFPWHGKFTGAVRKAGKRAILHCDGDLRIGGLLGRIARMYDGLHPLDLAPKSTLAEAMAWVDEVASAREEVGALVFFTGAPVDLVFNDAISTDDFLQVPFSLLRRHGPRFLVVATTHSEYPGRSYREELPRRKVATLRERLLQWKVG